MTTSQSQAFWMRVAAPNPARDRFFRLLPVAAAVIAADIILAALCL